MDVSIVILNYNTFDLTCRCIASVLGKTDGLQFEIIVVDNQSTERDPQEFKNIFPEIILIKSPENLGFAKGNNVGIAKAQGKFILLLNSDTFLLNNAIHITRDFLIKNPTVAVATGRLEFPGGRIQHNCQRFPSIGALIFECLRLQKILPSLGAKVLLGSFFHYNSVAYPDWVWGTFFMFRRSLLQKLPGKMLSDDFFMYGEDMQWCMEFKKQGYKIAFLPDARIEHLLGGSGAAKEKLIAEHHTKFMEKYYSAWERKVIRCLSSLLRKA
jgi:GT2 family glycosyltransferase